MIQLFLIVFLLGYETNNMVSKRVVRSRASRGYIPSKNKLNDRARRVSELFKAFSNKLLKSTKPKMISFSEKLLRVCEIDDFFSGRNPFISGTAVFVFSVRRFSPNGKSPVTYREMQELEPFATGQSFQDMLNYFSKRFP